MELIFWFVCVEYKFTGNFHVVYLELPKKLHHAITNHYHFYHRPLEVCGISLLDAS